MSMCGGMRGHAGAYVVWSKKAIHRTITYNSNVMVDYGWILHDTSITTLVPPSSRKFWNTLLTLSGPMPGGPNPVEQLALLAAHEAPVKLHRPMLACWAPSPHRTFAVSLVPVLQMNYSKRYKTLVARLNQKSLEWCCRMSAAAL